MGKSEKLTNVPGKDGCAQESSDSSNTHPFFTHTANDFLPCWSSDGSSVAYKTFLGNDDDEIAVMDVMTGQVTRLILSASTHTFCAWKEVA